jgi:uncharacterized protein YbjQ (UPF0145 family)
VEIIVALLLLVIGIIFGQLNERAHYRDIERREKLYRRVLVLPQRFVPPELKAEQTRLVCGSVVVASDYFKRVAAGLKQLIGGRLGMYESLLDRARREAILRLKEDAFRFGAHAVCNLKIQTSSISQGAKGQIGSVEVLAYGTAVRPGTVRE